MIKIKLLLMSLVSLEKTTSINFFTKSNIPKIENVKEVVLNKAKYFVNKCKEFFTSKKKIIITKKSEFKLNLDEKIILETPNIIKELNEVSEKEINKINDSLKDQNNKLQERINKRSKDTKIENIKLIENSEKINNIVFLYEKTQYMEKERILLNLLNESLNEFEKEKIEEKTINFNKKVNDLLKTQSDLLEERIANRKSKKDISEASTNGSILDISF